MRAIPTAMSVENLILSLSKDEVFAPEARLGLNVDTPQEAS